jgi:ribosomal protein L37AE/L43A
MKNDYSGENKNKNEVGVELKYCEHCGGLWVRERGAGIVYCEKCQPMVADLPAPKKKPQRIALPVRPRTVIEDYAFEIEGEDAPELESADGDGMGGAA